jgi:rubrerythrin
LSGPRIIKKIETFDQAVKTERNVESGYDKVINEHIACWIAVEQDIVESYTQLLATTDDQKIRDVLGDIVKDSRPHAQMLRTVSDTFNKIMLDEERHAKLIQKLAQETGRAQNSSFDARQTGLGSH